MFMGLVIHSSGYVTNPLIEEIEQYLYDLRLRSTMPNTVDERIVILDIDERSLAAEGRWPWHRNKLGDMVNILFDEYDIRVMGFDMVFAEADDTSALKLIDQLKNAPETPAEVNQQLEALEYDWQTDQLFAESLIARDAVLGFVFKMGLAKGETVGTGSLPPPTITDQQMKSINLPFYDARGYISNLAELQDATQLGAFFSYPRSDDVMRKAPLVQTFDGDVYESLGLAVARLAMGSPPIRFAFAEGDANDHLSFEHLEVGDLEIPVDERLSMYVPFRGRQGSFPYVSATDVLNRKVTAERLKDKIVMVGTSAAGLLDLRATPVSDSYVGVEIHANVASAILDGRFLQSPPYALGIEVTQLFVNTIALAYLLPQLAPVWVAFCVIFLFFANIAFNLVMWQYANVVMPLASVLALVVGMSFLQIIYDYFIESRSKRRLGRMFGQYIPEELVAEMDANDEELSLEGENREMSVLFSDVRGFTTISEGLSPTELTQLMNEFLTPITGIIHDNRGTIDKYMGDCVMAFWGAPLTDADHANHALVAALAMVEEMKTVSATFAAKGWPAIKVGIGIASGPMNVGNMGSEFRMAYTVMGDTVNLGSRLEGITKVYGANIVVSQETNALIDGFTCRELDRVRVKGKNEPITIFEPLGKTEDISSDLNTEVDKFHQALACYRKQDWDGAEALFNELETANSGVLYQLYLDRIKTYRAEPPGDDWDGVFTLTSK